MTTTAIGLFDGFSEARRVIHTLVAQGVRREDITIVANREETSVSDVIAAAAWGVNVDVGPASQGQPAALIALGVPADEAQSYAKGIMHGGALVSVAAVDHQVDPVVELMERYTAEELAVHVAPSEPVTCNPDTGHVSDEEWRPMPAVIDGL
jgi:hypothetical protein